MNIHLRKFSNIISIYNYSQGILGYFVNNYSSINRSAGNHPGTNKP